jgi:NADPH:quinone reductase-like Zn-dependent oxidoreductase
VQALAPDGTLTVIAVQGGTQAEVDLRLLMRRRVTLRAMTLRARPRTGRGSKAAVIAQVREHIWPLFESGEVQPVVGVTMPLADADGAHGLMGSAQAPGGKILLVR